MATRTSHNTNYKHSQISVEIPSIQQQKLQQQESWTYSQRVVKSFKDAAKAKCCTYCFYFLLAIAACGILSYQYSEYMDEDMNSITRSELIAIKEITFPYFYIETGAFDSVSLDALLVNNDEISSDEINTFNINDFQYNEAIIKWSVVYMSNDSAILIVPPYNTKLKIGSTIAVAIMAKSTWADALLKPYTFQWEGVAQHFTNELYYGLFWYADSVENLKNINGFADAANVSRNDKFEQYEFTLVSTINFVQMDSFKRINKINPNKNNEYYEMTSKASILYQNYSQIVAKSAADPDYKGLSSSYRTEFYFYYNPIGGGVQTVLTTDRKFGFTDVFSKTGGIFSPFKDGVMTFLGWILFGIGCCGGIAAKKGLDKGEKEKIRVYLEEIGLIDENTINNIKQKEKEYKDGGCCCC